MPAVNIAVVGLGRMGRRHVHNLIHKVLHARVVAVCTTDPRELDWARSNPEYQELGIQAFDNYQQMISVPYLQAVWISTSTDVHASQSSAAIEKDLHVLCEKPLSTDLREVRNGVNLPKYQLIWHRFKRSSMRQMLNLN